MKTSRSPAEERLGPRLFSYAVIADTHVNHGEKTTNAVYPVNALANGRLRHVVRDINNQQDLEFVIHLGDMVHPVPAVPDLFAEASARFYEITAELKYPLHLVPGNHDVGDKPCDWTPAVCIRDRFLKLYRDQFGSDFYGFEHKGVHFILLNAQLLNSGLAAEQIQREWLERYFESHAGRRFVVNMHYPVFLTARDEDSHYDNIDEPGRTWILDLLEKYEVEVLFAGHVHNFWYQRYAKTDCYFMPSTGFVRQDYSEMARIPPAPGMEGGRNDGPKLAYFLVHVHQHGHMCRVMRTYGEVAEPETRALPPAPKVEPLHPLENWRAPLGFDMRHDWMELVQVPPSGQPDEFNRKVARNDYPLMALWEMGVRRLRIPKLDVQDPSRRERLHALRDHGHEFVLYTYGIPDAGFQDMLAENPGLIAAWEIAFPWSDLDKIVTGLAPVRDRTGIPVYLSKLRGKEEYDDGAAKYVHAVNHGFVVDEVDQIMEIARTGSVDGVVFRVASNASVWHDVIAAGDLCAKANIAGSLIARMSAISPGDVRNDDLWAANRVAEAIAAAVTQSNLHVIIDTFSDFDRGFFRRNGVVDRLYNPRLAFHVIRHLYGVLNADTSGLWPGEVVATERTRSVFLERGSMTLVLIMPQGRDIALNLSDEIGPGHSSIRWSCTDLRTGEFLSDLPSRIEAPVLLAGESGADS